MNNTYLRLWSKVYLLFALFTLSALACGTATTLPTVDFSPVPATQGASTPISGAEWENTSPPTRTAVLAITGCWNIREGAGVAYPSLYVQCGGTVEFVHWADNGFIRIVGGYICNRAVDGGEECE